MSQTNDVDDFDDLVNDLNPMWSSGSGTTAWQRAMESAAADNAQIVLSDLLAAGIDALFSCFTKD